MAAWGRRGVPDRVGCQIAADRILLCARALARSLTVMSCKSWARLFFPFLSSPRLATISHESKSGRPFGRPLFAFPSIRLVLVVEGALLLPGERHGRVPLRVAPGRREWTRLHVGPSLRAIGILLAIGPAVPLSIGTASAVLGHSY
jgi:hypothetical protein